MFGVEIVSTTAISAQKWQYNQKILEQQLGDTIGKQLERAPKQVIIVSTILSSVPSSSVGNQQIDAIKSAPQFHDFVGSALDRVGVQNREELKAHTGEDRDGVELRSGDCEPRRETAGQARSLLLPRGPMSWYANPQWAITAGMIEIILVVYFMSSWNIVEGDFFRIGPPIQLFQYTISGQREYIGVLMVFFLHQLVFTWLNEVVAPWILNEVQDPKCKLVSFPKGRSILIINLYYVYFTMNSFMVINVSMSQISFLLAILCADIIAVSTINIHYLWNKKSVDTTVSETLSKKRNGVSSSRFFRTALHFLRSNFLCGHSISPADTAGTCNEELQPLV